MTPITVHLNDDVAEQLRRLAAAQSRSETNIVCEALAAYVQPGRHLPNGLGKFHSGQSNVSELARNLIRQAVNEKQC